MDSSASWFKLRVKLPRLLEACSVGWRGGSSSTGTGVVSSIFVELFVCADSRSRQWNETNAPTNQDQVRYVRNVVSIPDFWTVSSTCCAQADPLETETKASCFTRLAAKEGDAHAMYNNSQYPPQGYPPPQQSGYPAYPPQGYPPQPGYPPQQQSYPPPQGYVPQPGAYPAPYPYPAPVQPPPQAYYAAQGRVLFAQATGGGYVAPPGYVVQQPGVVYQQPAYVAYPGVMYGPKIKYKHRKYKGHKYKGFKFFK